MSGFFRFLLAALVVVDHLVGSAYFEHYGTYAVPGFFVLSGFVITAALNDVYQFDGRRFWTNRALRLLPTYLLVCLVTLICVSVWPLEMAEFLPRWNFNLTWSDTARNLLVLPLAFAPPDFRFIVPAWSIAVELIMYGLLVLGMARSERWALICFLAGCAWNCSALALDASFDQRYFSVAAALFAFGLGSLLYFWRKRGAFTPDARFALVAFVAWFTNVVVQGAYIPFEEINFAGYYINTALAALVVAALPSARLGGSWTRFDIVFGHLAYPVFLAHWIGAFLTMRVLGFTLPLGWPTLFASLPMILILATALSIFQLYVVEPLRRKNRPDQLTGFPLNAGGLVEAPLS